MTGFGNRLLSAFEEKGHLCVGIDPHPHLLRIWDFPDTPSGLREFSYRVLDLCAEHVGIIKPQVAFFERHGSEGFSVLESLIHRAHNAQILVISDAKRGDIGSTMQAYSQAWLTPEWHLSSDAITLSPYLGIDSLEETINYALLNDKGVFVLAATSNPEAQYLQTAVIAQGPYKNSTVASSIMSDIERWSYEKNPLLSVGAVVGATLNLESYGINPDFHRPFPILAPGFGHQGAKVEDATSIYGALSKYLIVSETRGLLSEGPEMSKQKIKQRVEEVANSLG